MSPSKKTASKKSKPTPAAVTSPAAPAPAEQAPLTAELEAVERAWDRNTEWPDTSDPRTVLDVPYAKKDLAKAAGARWDGKEQVWFAPPGTDLEKLAAFVPTAERLAAMKAEAAEKKIEAKRTILDVPYEERELAKAAGARWDGKEQVWYAPAGADLEKLKEFVPTAERLTAMKAEATQKKLEANRTLLDVAFKDKDLAKAAGARWDGQEKAWYAPAGADLEKLKAFIPTAERLAAMKAEAAQAPLEADRTVLDVPFKQKDLAKAAGARWDGKEQLWYAPAGADLEKLKAFVPTAERLTAMKAEAAEKKIEAKRTILDVPYEERELAKAAGARWHGQEKIWYAPPDADMEKLKAFVPTAERLAAMKAEAVDRKLGVPLTILDVPYEKRDLAKAAGARWNGQEKVWHAPPGADLEKLKPFVPSPERLVAIKEAAAEARALAVPCSELNTLGVRPQTHNNDLFDNTWAVVDGKLTFPTQPKNAGLWISNTPNVIVERVVFVERPVDAMSHAQLEKRPGALYVAPPEGQPSLTAEQRSLLRQVIERSNTGDPGIPPPTVITAFSNSAHGAALHKDVATFSKQLGAPTAPNYPTHGTRWNDALQMKEQDYIRGLGQRAPKAPSLGLRP